MNRTPSSVVEIIFMLHHRFNGLLAQPEVPNDCNYNVVIVGGFFDTMQQKLYVVLGEISNWQSLKSRLFTFSKPRIDVLWRIMGCLFSIAADTHILYDWSFEQQLQAFNRKCLNHVLCLELSLLCCCIVDNKKGVLYFMLRVY